MATPRSGLPHPTLLAFALPNVLIGVATTAVAVVLPAFFAKYTAASLAAVAAGVFLARLIEVGSDPLVGYFSDTTRSRLGPRKPWLLGGAALMSLGVFFLFDPPPGAGGVYFTVWLSVFFLAWTMINIPYRAWAVELTRDYDERSRIFTTLGIAYGIGATAFAAAPFLPVFDSPEMAPPTVRAIGWSMVVAFPLFVLITVRAVPAGDVPMGDRPTLAGLLRSVRNNRPFWWFVAAYMLGGVAQGMVLACFLFYVENYLGVRDAFASALLAVYLGGLLGMPLWLQIMRRAGKHRTWAFGWGGAAVLGVAMAFVPKGPDGLAVLLAVSALYGFASCVEIFAPFSVLGDVIDYDQWRTNVNRAGNYNAFGALIQKANIAIGSAVAFLLLDLFDYDVTGAANSGRSDSGFLLTFIAIPAVLYLASSWVVWRFPLDRRRHEIVRRRLEQRRTRSDAAW